MSQRKLYARYKYEEAKGLLSNGSCDKAISMLIIGASVGHILSMVTLGDILTTADEGLSNQYYNLHDGIEWYRIAASCNNEKAIAKMKELTGNNFTPRNVYREYLFVHLYSALGLYLPAALIFSRGVNLLGCLIVSYTLQAIIIGFYVLNNLFEMGNMNIPKISTDPYISYVSYNNSSVLSIGIGLSASILYSIFQLVRDTRGISGVSILLLILSWAIVGMIVRLLFILVLIKRKDTFSLGRSMGLLERVGLIKDSKWIKGAQGAILVSIVGLLLTGLLLVTVQAKA